MSRHAAEQGFSAVEMLVTLIVGLAFLLTGYMLYSTVLSYQKSSHDDDVAHMAAGLMTDRIVNNRSDIGLTCGSLPYIIDDSPGENWSYGTYSINADYRIDCPDASNLPNLRKLTYTARIGNGESTRVIYFTQ